MSVCEIRGNQIHDDIGQQNNLCVINTQLDNFVSRVYDIETQHMFVSAKKRWVMYETNPIENTCTNIQG